MQNSHTDLSPIYRVRVAVPVHVFDCFDYTMSAEQFKQAQIGARVMVSFGRQNLVGVIIEKLPADTPLDPRFKLKAVTELLDERAIRCQSFKFVDMVSAVLPVSDR